MVSDAESRTIDACYNRHEAARGKAQGVPNPGTFLLNRDGVIRARLFFESHRTRHTSAALIEAMAAIGPKRSPRLPIPP